MTAPSASPLLGTSVAGREEAGNAMADTPTMETCLWPPGPSSSVETESSSSCSGGVSTCEACQAAAAAPLAASDTRLTMKVAVTVLSLHGVTPKKKRKKKKTAASKDSSAAIVASFPQNLTNETSKVFFTHVPSLRTQLDLSTDNSKPVFHWPVDESLNDAGGCKLSTLEFTRTFVRESGTADRYVPQICPVNLSIQRGSNLALLGKANLTINGEENGATSISVPIDPVNIREKSTVKKLKNKATMSQNNKSVKVKGDRFRFQLERTAMLRVSVQVFEDDEASMPSVECALVEETADEADTAILSVDIAGSQRPPGQEILHPTKEVHTSTQRDAVFVATPPPDEYQGDDSSSEQDDYAGCILENNEPISSMAGLTVQPSADKADARENFEERIVESQYAYEDDDDEIPNLDELSSCSSPIASDRGALMFEGSPADVLAWTALGMLLGNEKSPASLAPFSLMAKGASVFEDDEASIPSIEGPLDEIADEADTAILSVDIEGSQRPPGQEILHPTKEVHTSTQRDAVFVAAPPPDEYQGDVYIDNESTADEDDPIRTPSVVHHFAVAYCEPGSCSEDFYCKPIKLFEDDDGGSCSDSDESMMTSIDDEVMEDTIRAYRSQLRTSRRKRKKSKSRSSGLRRRWSSDSSSSLTSRSSFYRLCCTLDRIPEEVGVEYDERQDSSLEYDDYAGCILENEELISSMASLTIQPSADKVDASDLAAKGASVFEDEASMPSIDGTLDETADEADIAILSADNEGSQRPPGQEILLPKKEVYPSSQRAVFLATAAQEILLPTTIKILFALPFSMSFPREQ